ncbi:hypothetical protein K505DRAFT_252168 [Melanomma pulvis-pyrius CBS 109.77]|uniref:Xylanolytic transcriptional activator regulatory domain-containing protein n=1 Tax=Melanomma pulvis-pyrius CBS 109.77 TaxID=1314802 RepID=A0A6A6X1F8_9PLEO|nr:hypothetical protein K505DRAFT_252168 [Melanomma pulvis-pyrius CBS 109.77]
MDATIDIPPTPSLSQDDQAVDAVNAESFRPGYLGPTSYALILPRSDESSLLRGRQTSVDSEHSDLELSYQHHLTKSIRTQMATDILKTLRHFKLIHEFVLDYCEACKTGVVPTPLEADAVNALKMTVDEFNLLSTLPDPRLIATVLENTSRPLNISPALQPREFYKTCTGDNLRFETIGYILATAGRSMLWELGPFRQGDNSLRKSQLADEMLRSSTTCLFICSLVSPVNDVMIWMFHENLLLTNMMCGYAGPPAWRRLGELTTQIYALGIHKESNGSNLPRFILESRRRIFCSTYNQDKTISTFLGRPIRLSKRHTDIKLPLDISDDDLTGDEAGFIVACRSLDDNGWNTNEKSYGGHLRASWLRARYISHQFREEILDFALAKVTPNVKLQLLDISRRIRESWNSFPSHIRYEPMHWNEDVPSGVRLALVYIYLTHFYNEFMIQKLLDSYPLIQNVALLRVSMDLLSATMILSVVRDRAYDMTRDFFHAVLLFGIPSGSVLSTVLQEQHRTGQPFPDFMTRSEIIRKLSVLISHLDTAARLDSGASPGDGNYNHCRKAAKAFTRVIDTVLNAESDVPPSGAEMSLNLDMFTAPGLDGFDGMDLGSSGLADGFDWGAIGQWTL